MLRISLSDYTVAFYVFNMEIAITHKKIFYKRFFLDLMLNLNAVIVNFGKAFEE